MPVEAPSVVPYCGTPPIPGEWLTAWNRDPVLLGVFAAALLLLMGLSRRHAGDGVRHRPLCLMAGWLVLAVALISPLCNLTSALFSARVAQHLLVIQVAAPLFVLAWPPAAIRWPAWIRALARPLGSPEIAWGAFGLFLWLWHLPGPYMAALASDAVLWTMHGTLFAGALAAWRSVLAPSEPTLRMRGLLAAFGTSVHLAMLAGLLIFAAGPLFPYHATTTAPWGISPLEDQQLGGLIMGVVGSTVYVALNLLAAARWLRQAGESSGRLGAVLARKPTGEGA